MQNYYLLTFEELKSTTRQEKVYLTPKFTWFFEAQHIKWNSQKKSIKRTRKCQMVENQSNFYEVKRKIFDFNPFRLTATHNVAALWVWRWGGGKLYSLKYAWKIIVISYGEEIYNSNNIVYFDSLRQFTLHTAAGFFLTSH